MIYTLILLQLKANVTVLLQKML